MANNYTEGAGSWTLSDSTGCDKLLYGLQLWAKAIEDGSEQFPTINISGAPTGLYDALADFKDIILNEPDEFLDTLRGFEIIEHDYSLYYGSEYVQPGMVAEIMRLFLFFEPDGTEWRMTWAERCDKLRPDNFSGGIIIANRDTIEMYGIDDLYDRFRAIGAVDDREMKRIADEED